MAPPPRSARMPFRRRLLTLQQRQRQQLLAEIGQIQGLLPLLMKARNGGQWSATERRQLQQSLHALSHLFPYLILLATPGSLLLLPIFAWWLDRRRQRRY